MKHRLVIAVAAVVAFLPGPGRAQSGVTWKWTGDWGPFSQAWKCPNYCLERPVAILRSGKSPVADTVVMADTNGGGATYQYIVMGRQYAWRKATGFVTFAGTVDSSGGTRAEANAARIVTGVGRFIGKAANHIEAASFVMDDAARDFLAWEAESAKKPGGGGGGTVGSGPRPEVMESLRNSDKEFDAFKREQIANLLAKAEGAIARRDLKGAELDVKLAAIVGRTPAVVAMEERVRRLLDEQAAARKASGMALPEPTGKVEPAPDRKALFAGNPGNQPYPNPYDSPDPERPVAKGPCSWTTQVRRGDDPAFLKKDLKTARKAHDGYRLLQHACRHVYDQDAPALASELLAEVDRIARFNRDPWLMFHLAELYRQACRNKAEDAYPLRFLPAFFYQQAYRLAVLRGDAAPLDALYTVQRNSDVIHDLTVRDIDGMRTRLRGP